MCKTNDAIGIQNGIQRRKNDKNAKTNDQIHNENSKNESIDCSKSPVKSILWLHFNSTFVSNFIIAITAWMSVYYEITTSSVYTKSPIILLWLRINFTLFLCLNCHVQLQGFCFQSSAKSRSIKEFIYGHSKALSMMIIANSAGSSVIQPMLGLSPNYLAIIARVIPTYVIVELVLWYFPNQLRNLYAIASLGVAWLKAITISTLVERWYMETERDPIAFILVSTANLSASGLVLRYITHYHRSRCIFAKNVEFLKSFTQVMILSICAGTIAYTAHMIEGYSEWRSYKFILYCIIAWIALNRYWKPKISLILMHVNKTVKQKQ